MTTVLVVEDEALTARTLQRALKRLGYHVPQLAGSAGEALRAMATVAPDLVLMDINLKGDLDGIATAATIRRRWDVPVVFLTSHSDDATLARAKDTGPHGYLIKPFNDRDLRITIEVALRKHQLEAELAKRERWFSTTLQSIGDAVIAADGEDRITFMNAVAERITGWTLQAAKGRRLDEVFRLLGEDGEPLSSPIAQAIARGFAIELPANTQLIARDDRRRDVDDSSAPIIDDRGQLLGGVVVFRDVTERKRLERKITQAERLAAIGTMAAGMAHELNSPLAAVIANLEVAVHELREIEGTLGEGSPLATKLRYLLDALGDAQEGADRVTRTVQELRKFVRTGEREREALDLPDVLDAAIAAVGAGSGGDVVVERRYGTTPYVDANRARLVQVFGNLVANAIRAVADVTDGQRWVLLATSTDEEGRAIVEVRDSGAGIAAGDLARVFDPFSGARGVGLGLGLGVSQGIVSGLGGEITVESEVGRGSVFRVVLPAAGGKATTRTPEAVVAQRVGSGERRRLLVVDDELVIGRLFARVLDREHDVFVEHEPRAALERIKSGEDFDLIFCDVMMPDLTGPELYRLIAQTRPGVEKRIVFVSGGAIGEETQAFLAATGNVVLDKPFGQEALRAFVRSRLGVHAA